MKFRRYAWLFPVLALPLLALACGDEDEELSPTSAVIPAATLTPALTEMPASEATPSPSPAPTGATRAGITEVDAVIDAVLSRDAEVLRPLVLFTARPCTSSGTAVEQPLCRPNESEGALVDVLTETISGSCRIAVRTLYLRSDEIDDLLGSLALEEPSLYAVYRAAAEAGGPSQYNVVFARSAAEAGYEVVGAELRIEGSQVVSVNLHCGETFAELVENVEPQDFVVPPHEP